MKELRPEELSLEQKIGMVLTVRGFLDDDDKAFVYEMIDKRAVGAIQVRCTPGCEKTIEEIKSHADYPILICADMEHGYPCSELHIPQQIAISATDDEETAYEFGRVTAIEAKRAGYNMVWGPVVDLAVEGAQCKNNRCLSDDPAVVARYACAIIRGYQDEGMACTAKHFPGGSDTVHDSHIRPNISMRTKEQLLEKELVPYLEAMKSADLSGIMASHGIYANIDGDTHTTFSKKILGIIREIGFEGMIVSDSLAMMTVVRKYGMKESVPKALAAGIDMVLPSYRLSFREAYNAMMEGYRSGLVTEERLNDAVAHVLAAQRRTLKQPSATEVSERQKEIIRNISKNSLCAITHDGESVALDPSTKKLFVILCENSYPEMEQESGEIRIESWFSRKNAERKKELILKEFPGSEVIIMNEFPNQTETEAVCVGIAKAEETIFFTFCRASSYLASDSLTKRMEYIIQSNVYKISTVVHIGSPYALRTFKGIKRVLYGVPGGEGAEYAVDALKGKFVPSGKLPVRGGIEEELRRAR